jgi:CubicO group peptidase (beta-lactamase class C family)
MSEPASAPSTKQFTAAAILRLVEQRKLSLDDPISRYVPGLQTHGRPVSIRQLLNHTSGIRSFTAIPAFASKERLDLTDDELLGVFQNEPPNDGRLLRRARETRDGRRARRKPPQCILRESTGAG